MKFAIFIDTCLIKSYYIKDKKAYGYHDNKPYTFWHAISSECFTATWHAPFLFDEGYFINLQEWDLNNLPDLDLDLIFYANEKCGLDDENRDKYRVDKLRKKYPNAKILGWIKEIWTQPNGYPICPYDFNVPRHRNRIEHLNECDGIVTTGVDNLKSIEVYNYMQEHLDKKIQFVTLPLFVDYFYDNLYSNEKSLSIFGYLPNPIHRRSNTYEFASYIGEKYNIPVKFKPLNPGQKFDYLSLKDFINLWSPSLFHFNLDPMDCQPGQQALLVGGVGSINIGGMNESHQVLFPETATCDLKILEDKFVQYLEDENKRFEVIEYAWNKINELYHPSVFVKQVENIFNTI
tara:strand:- start:631 stop:1671 length:1041 start_codon:yes stop_codon:yes gene_type:complete